MQHWMLCMSSWYCLGPFQKLLLKGVHRNLIRWISIIRLLEESPTLTSFLIYFTRSISHLSLVVLVTDCQFWQLLHLKVLIMVVVTKNLASVTTGLLIMLPFRHALLMACGNRSFQKKLKSQLTSLSTRNGLLRSALWLTKYGELARLCFLANVSRPEFWWQLVGGRVLRYRSISVQSNALLPATCSTWFLSKCVDILVPNSWFGYRCRSSCSSSILFQQKIWLRIQHVILVSGLCRCKRSLFIFSRNCLTTTNVVRPQMTSIGCQLCSRKLLCFRKWTDGQLICCHWVSFIPMFAVPSCSHRWIR